jgi:hypothetical protein
MKPINVELVDEDVKAAKAWKASLDAMRLGRSTGAKKLDVRIFDVEKKLKDCIDQLTQRRERARRGESDPDKSILPIDEVEIFVVDYDLLGANGSIGYTGEEFAYLVRCYSACKVIVAINQFTTENVFELDLAGHPDSYADVNITSPQINNPGLWHSPWSDEFRPWYWPVLPDLVRKFDKRVDFVRENFDKPVLASLGFDADLVRLLPRKVEAFLSRRGAAEAVTFKDFVRSSGNGLRPKDEVGDGPEGTERLCRIAAARVNRWLEDLVLSGQEILIDTPHLLARHAGFLQGNSPGSIRAWNKAAQIPSYGKEGSLEEELGIDETLTKFALNPIWADRPAWFWPKIVADGKILGSRDRIWPDIVFCEDTSRFAARESARQFVADVESAHVRRYVSAGVPGVVYRPEVRLSL